MLQLTEESMGVLH